MRLAAIQMCSGTDISDNLRDAEGLIRDAAKAGAELIATPEMTHILQKRRASLMADIRYEADDRGVAHFAALAKELGLYLLIGSMAIKSSEDKALNRSFLFGPTGACLARYDKIHLFDVNVSESERWMESRVYDRGDKAVMANAGAATLGLSVCYDLRFAHLYRHYGARGAHILTVPAAFTRPTGEAHWEVLLRARAIETGSFVLAPAQVGTHADGRKTWGHSMIIDPWGNVLVACDGEKTGFIIADIDLSEVDDARARIPAWNHNPSFSCD